MNIFDKKLIPLKELRAMGSGIGLRGNMVKKPKEPTPPKVDVDPDPNDNKDDKEPEEPKVEEPTDTPDENPEDNPDDTGGEEDGFNEEDTTVDEGDIADDAAKDAGGDDTPQEIPEEDYNTDANDALQVSDSEANFLKDVNSLYFSIRNTISRLEMVSFDDLLTNKVIIQVKQNLNVLLDYVYDFIIYKYEKMTYGQNLYIYTHLVLSYKENIHILKNIRTLADTI